MRAVLMSASVLTVSMAACGGATGPTVDDVLLHRATWSAQGLNNYSFDYALRAEVSGVECPTAIWHITVRQDTVASMLCIASGQPAFGPSVTIDTLFDEALRAVRDHTLSSIAFDPRLGYPLRIDFAGPPDAAFSELVSDFRP